MKLRSDITEPAEDMKEVQLLVKALRSDHVMAIENERGKESKLKGVMFMDRNMEKGANEMTEKHLDKKRKEIFCIAKGTRKKKMEEGEILNKIT